MPTIDTIISDDLYQGLEKSAYENYRDIHQEIHFQLAQAVKIQAYLSNDQVSLLKLFFGGDIDEAISKGLIEDKVQVKGNGDGTH